MGKKAQTAKKEQNKAGRRGLTAQTTALGGILLALCMAAVFFSAAVPGVEMSLLLIASAGIFIFCREAGAAAGFVLYAAACLLGLLLVPNKLAVLPLAGFFGLYPVLKYLLEEGLGVTVGSGRFVPEMSGRPAAKALCLCGKVVYYAAAAVTAVTAFRDLFLGKSLFSGALSAGALFEKGAGALLLAGAAGLVFFLAYDIILSGCAQIIARRFGSAAGAATGRGSAAQAKEPPEIRLSGTEEQDEDQTAEL